MKLNIRSFKYILERYTYTVYVFVIISSCADFLEVSVDRSQITKDVVFDNDITASAAVSGIYSDMYNNYTSFSSGNVNGVSGLCGMSSDELNYYPQDFSYSAFEEYSLDSQNSNVLLLWQSMYYAIYGANSALEGLNSSASITPEVKDQLIGELLFVRAFSHFYLTNLFGDIPIITTSDYRKNAILPRSEVSAVYNQIIDDLILSQSLLSTNYVTDERTRPNKAVATALLARVYLYLGDWKNAELYSSSIIDDPRYEILSDLDEVFLGTSKEAIWQFKPSVPFFNTNESGVFILQYSPEINSLQPFALTSSFISSFESGDLRKIKWVSGLLYDSVNYFYPFKYKIYYGPLTEYSMVFRLAEMYLIRSESRSQLDDLNGSIADLDSIRNRAKLPLIGNIEPDISKDSLLLIIEHERQIELFSEWGHRWLDLKRTGRADVLFENRTGYDSNMKLYPIPQSEIDRNPFLKKQNDGY